MPHACAHTYLHVQLQSHPCHTDIGTLSEVSETEELAGSAWKYAGAITPWVIFLKNIFAVFPNFCYQKFMWLFWLEK